MVSKPIYGNISVSEKEKTHQLNLAQYITVELVESNLRTTTKLKRNDLKVPLIKWLTGHFRNTLENKTEREFSINLKRSPFRNPHNTNVIQCIV